MGRRLTRHALPPERRGARERTAASRLPATARPLAQAPLPLLELGHALDRAGERFSKPTPEPDALLAVMIQFIRSINASAIDFFPTALAAAAPAAVLAPLLGNHGESTLRRLSHVVGPRPKRRRGWDSPAVFRARCLAAS